MKMFKSVTADIVKCSRCGQDHLKIPVKKFKSPPVMELSQTSTYEPWNYWATCPITCDPILVHIDVNRYAFST